MIKVGDWVKCEGKIGEVVHVYLRENTAWVGVMFSVGCMDDVQKDLLTKLPIKFKGFEIVLQPAGDQLRWDIARAPRGGSIHISCVVVNGKFHVGMNPSKGKYICNEFSTIEEARDWLELQYATLLAKARGLV